MRTTALAFSLALPLSLSLAAPAAAATWELDPVHTTVGFLVGHMMVTDQKGAFDVFSGTIEVDDRVVTKSTIKVRSTPRASTRRARSATTICARPSSSTR